MSDILSAYQYYLGRYPEQDGEKQWSLANENSSLMHVRDMVTQSEEYRHKAFRCATQWGGTFFAPRANAPKICVLGNCQGPNIAMALAAIADEPLSIVGLELMNIAAQRDQILSFVLDADYVIACKVYSDEYMDVSADVMRSRYGNRVIEYSPVHFTGVHPDIFILGGYGQRVRSAMGDYNSRIVLSAYLSGMDSSQCESLFNEDIFGRADYFQEFGRSAAEMVHREEQLDDDSIKIADWFLTEVKNSPLLYTVNHPNSRVFEHFAKLILKKIGITARDVALEHVPNSLSGATVWPMDPVIGRAIGATYQTSPCYWSNNIPMPADEFIWRSFKAYEQFDKNLMAQAMGDRIIAF